jgi:hypothetical protein
MNMSGSFWNILLTSTKYLENIFDAWDKIFDDMEEYSTMCSWRNNTYG